MPLGDSGLPTFPAWFRFGADGAAGPEMKLGAVDATGAEPSPGGGAVGSGHEEAINIRMKDALHRAAWQPGI